MQTVITVYDFARGMGHGVADKRKTVRNACAATTGRVGPINLDAHFPWKLENLVEI